MGRAEDLFKRLKKEKLNAVNEFILERQREEFFLDFKRSSNNGDSNKLSNYDRKNLSKAISGFGNSEGGVLVWGIECSKKSDKGDVASAKFPIINPSRFSGLLDSAISGLTLPPHSRVENFSIKDNKQKGGFVITHIPQNKGIPLQDMIKKQFYIRAGSNFTPTPYQVLASMFGKQPQPNLYNMYTFGPAKLFEDTIETQTGFMLHNEGPGIARHMFLNVKIWSSPGPNCVISFDTNSDRENWGGSFNFEMFMYLMSKADLRLAPGAEAQPMTMDISFKPPFDKDLKIKVAAGCAGGPIYKGEIFTSKNDLDKTYRKYVTTSKWDPTQGHKVAQALIKSRKQ